MYDLPFFVVAESRASTKYARRKNLSKCYPIMLNVKVHNAKKLSFFEDNAALGSTIHRTTISRFRSKNGDLNHELRLKKMFL